MYIIQNNNLDISFKHRFLVCCILLYITDVKELGKKKNAFLKVSNFYMNIVYKLSKTITVRKYFGHVVKVLNFLLIILLLYLHLVTFDIENTNNVSIICVYKDYRNDKNKIK